MQDEDVDEGEEAHQNEYGQRVGGEQKVQIAPGLPLTSPLSMQTNHPGLFTGVPMGNPSAFGPPLLPDMINDHPTHWPGPTGQLSCLCHQGTIPVLTVHYVLRDGIVLPAPHAVRGWGKHYAEWGLQNS